MTRRRGPGRSPGTGAGPDGFADNVLTFPVPEPGAPAHDPGSRAEVLRRIRACAALGLELEEIEVRVGLPAGFAQANADAVETALHEGRLLGRAEIKRAQFEAARDGRVSAQDAVLERLGDADGAGEEEGEDAEGAENAVAVERVVVRRPEAPDEDA